MLVPHMSDVSAVARRLSAQSGIPLLDTEACIPARPRPTSGRMASRVAERCWTFWTGPPVLAIMIEDASALADIDALVAVPGVDIVVVGPSDLSASLGVVGSVDNDELPLAIDRVFSALSFSRGRVRRPVERRLPEVGQ